MDARVERFADLAAVIMAMPARLGRVRLVAVDGPAGSGKTTFAGRLARHMSAAGARVAEIHTDDLLAGWADLVSFWPRLEEWVLTPLAAGHPGRFRRYDWHRQRFDAAWHEVPVPDVLVVEGVTSARMPASPLLTHSVYVVADRDVRLARGLARDGESLRGEWLRWMAGEELHFGLDGTSSRADLVVDGMPTIAHDPEHEYVRLLSRARHRRNGGP